MTHEDEELTSIADQAAHWSVLLRDKEASPAEKREFEEWLKRSPESVEASLRVARVHAALSRSDIRWPQASAEDLIREATAIPAANVVPLHRHATTRPAPQRRRVMPYTLGLAASLLVAVGIGWFSMTRPVQFQTKVGEQRSLVLADGSRVTLNTNSQIEVRLEADRRVVELVQGQALFDVAHDARRPFDVQVGNVAVRAVGTQFDIDRREARTIVTVMEGRVAMATVGALAQPIPELIAGDRVVVDSAGSSTLEHEVNLAVATSWTKRQLVFQRRPLQEIAEEFNRYNAGRIEIRSPELREQEVTAVFRADDVPSFVAVLAGLPGVHVTADGAGGYLVTSNAPAAPQK